MSSEAMELTVCSETVRHGMLLMPKPVQQRDLPWGPQPVLAVPHPVLMGSHLVSSRSSSSVLSPGQ